MRLVWSLVALVGVGITAYGVVMLLDINGYVTRQIRRQVTRNPVERLRRKLWRRKTGYPADLRDGRLFNGIGFLIIGIAWLASGIATAVAS